jgi:hypothetical protein
MRSVIYKEDSSKRLVEKAGVLLAMLLQVKQGGHQLIGTRSHVAARKVSGIHNQYLRLPRRHPRFV